MSKAFRCAFCDAELKQQGCFFVAYYYKNSYFSCTNPLCGATFKGRAEVMELISPPSEIYSGKNIVHLKKSALKNASDAVVFFVQNELQRDHKQSQKTLSFKVLEYLQQRKIAHSFTAKDIQGMIAKIATKQHRKNYIDISKSNFNMLHIVIDNETKILPFEQLVDIIDELETQNLLVS